MKSFEFHGKQAIINTHGTIPQTPVKLLKSELFQDVLQKYLADLREKKSHFLEIFTEEDEQQQNDRLLELLTKLCNHTKEEVQKDSPHLTHFFENTYRLTQCIEQLYNFWRQIERFIVCYGKENTNFHQIPYTTFESTLGKLNHLVRQTYRDIVKNITNEILSVYRQVPAGAEVGVIARHQKVTHNYASLHNIPVIRNIMLEPPIILDPPMNKRSGRFEKVDFNPLKDINLNEEDFLCYPAKVGELVMLVYFHKFYIGLGTSVINLFDIASDEDLQKKPDAIYVYGAPDNVFKDVKTIFHEDNENDMMVAAVPKGEVFGYFGYLKKMLLTLHNIIMMKRGRLPVHGAMIRTKFKSGKIANVVILGDTGTGKSESIEAFRILGKEYIRDMTIIFDDMGSFDLKDGKVVGYGTETGAFVRLDDLQLGYTLGNVDRSIMMSPQKINARAVLPITTLREVLHGYPVDIFLYANNYETVDENHPYLTFFKSVEEALPVFKEGKRMSKGTTTETGILQAYFANIFGPAQYQELHDPIAEKFFKLLFDQGTVIGELRTQLGVPGKETSGPEEAARALFEKISE